MHFTRQVLPEVGVSKGRQRFERRWARWDVFGAALSVPWPARYATVSLRGTSPSHAEHDSSHAKHDSWRATRQSLHVEPECLGASDCRVRLCRALRDTGGLAMTQSVRARGACVKSRAGRAGSHALRAKNHAQRVRSRAPRDLDAGQAMTDWSRALALVSKVLRGNAYLLTHPRHALYSIQMTRGPLLVW